jgi:hypothetical protein
MTQKLNLVTKMSKTKCGIENIADVYFDLTLIINRDNEPTIVDNSVDDWRDFVDCSTALVKKIKARP